MLSLRCLSVCPSICLCVPPPNNFFFFFLLLLFSHWMFHAIFRFWSKKFSPCQCIGTAYQNCTSSPQWFCTQLWVTQGATQCCQAFWFALLGCCEFLSLHEELPNLIADCSQVDRWTQRQSAMRLIYPFPETGPITVLCDEGWLLVQRNQVQPVLPLSHFQFDSSGRDNVLKQEAAPQSRILWAGFVGNISIFSEMLVSLKGNKKKMSNDTNTWSCQTATIVPKNLEKTQP